MRIGIPKEVENNERRVAIPSVAASVSGHNAASIALSGIVE